MDIYLLHTLTHSSTTVQNNSVFQQFMPLPQRQSSLFFSALRCSHLASLAATSTYHARHTEKGDGTLILSHVHTQSMSSVGISNYHAKDTLITRDSHSRTSMHTHRPTRTHADPRAAEDVMVRPVHKVKRQVRLNTGTKWFKLCHPTARTQHTSATLYRVPH